MKLSKRTDFSAPKGPVVLAIMDGVGIGGGDAGDMVAAAATPHLDQLKQGPNTQLKAHGTAVGMPNEDDMGNSEVGHNAIGSGQVFSQGAKLVQEAVDTGALFEGATWKTLTERVIERRGTLHFLGLLSDGNVHSHIDHLLAMLRRAKADGVERVRVHILLDGRDVAPTSALEYVATLEAVLAGLNMGGSDFAIASGGGRLFITMDRYDADWPMIERGWAVHVRGAGRQFASAAEAIQTLRAETPDVIDQDLGSFVIAKDGKPIGPVLDGDSFILCNFRGDRAQEISKTFDGGEDFDKFDRGPMPDVLFAGMMEYDGDLKIPKRFLVEPPTISHVMGEYLTDSGVRILAISETQKYGHVTYFFNGNRSGKFDDDLEDYVEIPSDNVSFDERPWMKGAEITDVVLDSIADGKHDFIRINYPNGDMVGHTGNLLATQISIETTDLCIGRLMKALKATGGILIVTADHGNADEMFEVAKDGSLKLDAEGKRKPKTSHTLNPVPCYIYDPSGQSGIRMSDRTDLGISSLTATCIELLGFEAPEMYEPSVLAK